MCAVYKSMSDERELIIYYLNILFKNSHNHTERMAEQEENIREIKRAIALNPVLSGDERNILSFFYKSPVNSRRNSIRDCQVWLTEINPETQAQRYAQVTGFIAKLQDEVKNIALDLINLVDESLLVASTTPEQRVFFEKMKGDYYRYICENKTDPEFQSFCEKGKEAYENALEIARNELDPTSPQFLGLVLNFSVFLYDTLQMQSEAIELSQRTYTETQDMVESIDDNSYAESQMILQLLRDNHTKWIQLRDNASL